MGDPLGIGSPDYVTGVVKAAQESTVETAKLCYDIRVVKMPVSGNEVALPLGTDSEVRDDGRVDDGILGRETVRAPKSTGVVQDRSVERYHFGNTLKPVRYFIQFAALLLSTAYLQIAARRLLLLKGELQYEVRFDVDVHTTASYSMRPSWTAMLSPDSSSLRTVSVRSRALRVDRVTSPSQAPTSNSKA